MVSTDAGLPSPKITATSATLASIKAKKSHTAAENAASIKDSKRKVSTLFAKLSTQFNALNKLRPPRSTRKVISEYYIRLNEPHREYSPGDLVKGSVILTTEKDLRVTHLVVNLVGRVDLFGVATYNLSGKKKTVNYTGPVEFEGGIILCRDQQVLCGEGKLDAGVYEFGFVVELTGRGLPSSLDFEKGSISYRISATLTRPTTVSPTRICEHKINLVELIDIASYSPPKPRIIPLEIGNKRSRIRSSHGSSDEKGALKCGPNPNATSEQTTPNSSTPQITIDNASIKSSSAKKGSDVTATIELLKAGALRGESIPVKISIKHTKPVKSLHGIIVTLVRVGRFDTFPICANGLNSKGSESSLKKGLSLGSGGGTTTTFRKDLSQVIAPLIVDPNSLTTVVRTSVRVPEDSFPSIKSIPGQIVSFKYFVEVLVDLGGKLAGKEDFLNGVGMVNIPGATTGELGRVEASLGNDASGIMAVYGAKVIETEKIRRDVKSVVSCRFEVIVGTTDSANGKGRRREANISNFINLTTHDTGLVLDAAGERGYRHPGYGYDHMRTIIIPDGIVDNLLTPPQPSPPVQISLPATPVFPEDRRVAIPSLPPPDMDNLDEKTRLRMAERALLPSAPPGFGSAATSAATTEAPAYEPSAPHSLLPSAPPLTLVDGEGLMRPSAPPMGIDMNLDAGSAHFHSYQSQSSGSAPAQNEDKQELERQRLLAAASAPPLPECSGGDANGSRVGSSALPTAPMLCEDLDGELPRYQR
ncbi:hypothetical protein BGX38DRAFT_1264998 [Terfezia claveryi]|nr:hypothetical protein BGX38DRAFT_1264998 [Terfezia claveryi]